MHSWRVLILPYLEHRELYDKYDFTQPWNSEANLRLAKEMPRVFAFHGEYKPGVVTTNYLAVVGKNTVWPGVSTTANDGITDDLSSTIMIVENIGEETHWMEPRDLHVDSMSFEVNHPKGVSSKYETPAVAMLDGSLRKLEVELPSDVFKAMLTVNGGEPLAATGDTWRLLFDGRSRQERPLKEESQR